MPLHPVIGRPAEVQAAGASLAAHQATRELPTAGPWAKFAAVAKKGEEAEGAAAAATTIAAADAPSEQQQQQQASSAPSADSDSVPAVLVQGLDFSYPDIGEGGKITLAASKRTSIAIEISSAARARARESVVAGAWRALSLNLDDRSRAPSSFLSPPSKKKKNANRHQTAVRSPACPPSSSTCTSPSRPGRAACSWAPTAPGRRRS